MLYIDLTPGGLTSSLLPVVTCLSALGPTSMVTAPENDSGLLLPFSPDGVTRNRVE